MIYTLTVTPSLDYHFSLDHIAIGTVMHAHQAYYTPGGKGINVSRALTALGVPNKAFGFIAGINGTVVEKMLDKEKVLYDFINIEGETRINVKVNSKEGETAFNLNGPIIIEEHLKMLYEKLDRLENGDILIMAGSVGRSSPRLYKEIISRYGSKFLCCVDAHGEALQEAMNAHPFFIKPNLQELSEYAKKNLTIDELPEYASSLVKEKGINYLLVSYGKEGALLASPTGVIQKKFTRFNRKVISTVGAGDVLVAAFLSKLNEGELPERALAYGVKAAAGFCYLGHVPSGKEIAEL